MRVRFIINACPFSINKMYYRKTFNRTDAARNWARVVCSSLACKHNQQQLRVFREEFNESNMGCRINLTFYYPYGILINKAGSISSRSQDLTNVEKPLVDLIFDPKYNSRAVPEGAPNLNLNDKVVMDLISRKRASNCYSIFIELESFDLEEIK